MAYNFKTCFKPFSMPKFGSIALLILRIIAGLAFMFHGWGKIQNPMTWMGPTAPVPGIFQALAAISEFGGGLCWILGLFMPVASLGLFFTMTVAVLTHAVALKDPFVASGPGQGSYEPALVYWGIAILFLAIGPGKHSVDSKIFGQR